MQELKDAARVALTDCAGVKPGENVVVVTDEPKRKIGLGVCLFSHERDNRIVLRDVTVKRNALALLDRELAARRRKPLRRGYVFLGGGVGDACAVPAALRPERGPGRCRDDAGGRRRAVVLHRA